MGETTKGRKSVARPRHPCGQPEPTLAGHLRDRTRGSAVTPAAGQVAGGCVLRLRQSSLDCLAGQQPLSPRESSQAELAGWWQVRARAPTASAPVSACAGTGLPALPCNLWPQFPRLYTEGRGPALWRGLLAAAFPAFPRAQPRCASCSTPRGQGSPSLAQVSPQGRYLVRGPRLLVGPVPVAPHVPPLDLQRVGGGATAAEGAGHLHVLARPCSHVVRRLCEQGCVEKVGRGGWGSGKSRASEHRAGGSGRGGKTGSRRAASANGLASRGAPGGAR